MQINALCNRGIRKMRPGPRLLSKTLLIMKMVVILMTVFMFHVHAAGVAQTITLAGKDMPLKKVFDAIEHQTGFVAFYNMSLLASAKPVSMNVSDKPLVDFLELVMKDQPIAFIIGEKTIILSPKPVSDGSSNKPIESVGAVYVAKDTLIEVRGRVLYEDGEPATVSIFIKGTRYGTSSSVTGHFVLTNVNPDATLVITGVNIEQTEIKLNGSQVTTISVKRKVVAQEEVVITSFGAERKTKELGYSTATVSGEDLNRALPPNLLVGLAGRVSGLNISTMSTEMNPQMKVLLRGIRSFTPNSSNQPLIIFNGSPLSFGSGQYAADLVMSFINNLNPSDIQDVTFIKGANGAALYGSEGVNGVIIITTKKGNKGMPSIALKNTTGFAQLDYRYQNFFQQQFGVGGAIVDPAGNPVYDPVGVADFWGPEYNNEMVPIGRPDEHGEIQMVPYRYTNDRRKFYNIGVTNQTNLSLSQSDGRSDLYFNIGYTKQTGIIPKDEQSRTALFLNTSRQLGKVGFRINVNYTRTVASEGLRIITEYMAPHVPVTRYHDYENDHWSDRNHYWSDVQENPYETVDRVRTHSTSNIVFGNIEVKVAPVNWLTITERVGINYAGTQEKGTYGPQYYSDFAKSSGRAISSLDRNPSVRELLSTDFSINNDLLLQSVIKSGDFVFRGLAGNNIRENYYKNLLAVSGPLAVPIYNLIYATEQVAASERAMLSRSYSFFGSASIGYKDNVFLEITGRDDWDSKLAVEARGNNFYYGANTSLILKELIPFLSGIRWLSGARLRASVTRTANMNIEPHQAQRYYTLAPGFPYVGDKGGTGLVSYYPYGSFPNYGLKPEKVISQEYGANFSFLRNRINLDVSFYTQANDGMILPRSNSRYSAYPGLANSGRFRNYGWEFDLRVDPLFQLPNGLSVSMQGGFTINENRVLSLDEDTIFQTAASTVARVGRHAFEFRVFDWQRDPYGRVIVDRQTGMPVADNENPVYTGRVYPKYTANFNLNLIWKNLSLNAVAEYRGGHQLFDNTSIQSVGTGAHPMTTQNGRKRFVFPNSVYTDGSGHYVENTNIAVRSTGRDLYQRYKEVTSLFIINSAFWKIRELSANYTISSKGVVQKLTIGLFCRNPFSFFPNRNMIGDPELVRDGFRFDRSAINNTNTINASTGASGSGGNPGTNDGIAPDKKFPGSLSYGLTLLFNFK